MELSSTVFTNNKSIPHEYTCDGENVNPELIITGVPENSKSLALIMDDPDAPMGTWVHWVAWNIPPDLTQIPRNSPPLGIEGVTSFDSSGYGGPCPPSGSHRYFFKIYALDSLLDIPEDSDKKTLENAMEGHILDSAELIGLYSRN